MRTRRPHTITRLSLGIFAAFIALSIVYVSATLPHSREASASGGNALTGYAWSDNIGWVSLSGPSYGVVINSNKTLSGYAWGDNIGWISFNASDVGGCGTAPSYNPNNQALSGWARALNTGGDGCISLSGSGYGVMLNGSHTYAWGSDTVGWLDFAYSTNPCPNGNGQSGQCTSCDPGYTLIGGVCYVQCPNGQGAAGSCTSCNSGYALSGGNCVLPAGSITKNLKAVPPRVKSGDKTTLSWTTTGMTSCSLKRSDTGATVSTALSSPANGVDATNIIQTTTFTLTCQDNVQSYTSTATVGLLPVFQEK